MKYDETKISISKLIDSFKAGSLCATKSISGAKPGA